MLILMRPHNDNPPILQGCKPDPLKPLERRNVSVCLNCPCGRVDSQQTQLALARSIQHPHTPIGN